LVPAGTDVSTFGDDQIVRHSTQHLFSALGDGYVRAAATLHVRAAIARTLFQL
jgi:hypothetical protein